ncbi:hypothetical protein HFO98_07875 [Rhizobium leguminosarum]|uniref:hypothetical protein n=1 Tax=Rhizobium leguminosarum TaxID=384 RepID=UPI001C98AD75|nr:hypothetical protein [Rhizobium leguminosarum]MBY5408395.1 hypothetical protein [Rhizobium leguminosarum]
MNAFSTGSMAPKVATAIQFAKSTGRQAAIGKLEVAATIARGEKRNAVRSAIVRRRKQGAGFSLTMPAISPDCIMRSR